MNNQQRKELESGVFEGLQLAALAMLPKYFPTAHTGDDALIDALAALDQFNRECPTIPDFKRDSILDKTILAGLQGAYLPWTEETEETHYNKTCPEYDHDCMREGCGRTVSESFRCGGEFVVKHPGGALLVAAEWVITIPGGYGI